MNAIYHALEAFQAAADEAVGSPSLWLLLPVLIALLGGTLFTLVHELGHAIACLACRVPVEQLRVGGEPHVTFTRGRFRLELSLREGEGGFVRHGRGALTPRRLVLIALAGPFAELVALGPLVLLASRAGGMLAVYLWVLAAGVVVAVVMNLWPRGANDGRVVQLAWAGRDEPLEEPEEHPGSVPPPDAPSPGPPAMRWPFAIALGLVFALTVATAVASGNWVMVLVLVTLFGVARLQQG